MKKTRLLAVVLLTLLTIAAILLVACEPKEHVCRHVCEVCGGCKSDCEDEKCKNKCTCQINEHVCHHVCEVCGGCLDETCGDPVCSEKCGGHKPAAPVIADKTDFVKLPGETVTAESFKSLVTSAANSLTYSYALKQEDADKGTLTDKHDGTFDFVPSGVYAGEVRIEFTVTDNHEQSASKTIALTYKAVNPVIYDAEGEKVVDKKDDFADVVMTVDTFGTESNTYYFDMTDIRLNGVTIGSDNFVLKSNGEDRYFSVKASYLASLAPAKYTFTLHTVAGSAPFVIEVKDTREVAVDANQFDFVKGETQGNVVVNVTPYANVVTAESFVIDGVTMTETEHFTYADNTFTLLNSFLNGLDKGIYKLKINGKELVTINVKTVDAPIIADGDKVKTAAKAAAADLTVSVQLFGKESETTVKLNGTALTAEQYSVAANAVTVKGDCLAALTYGEHTFTVVNSNGQAQFTLKLGDKPVASSDNQNVTKFTHETITDEALRVRANGDWSLSSIHLVSVASYDYVEQAQADGVNGRIEGLTASGAFGSVTLNETAMSFNFSRANGWFGVVTFTYTVTDELGFVSDEITMDVVYKQHAPEIDGQNDKVYNRADGKEIVFTIINAQGNSDFAVNKITCGNDELTLGEDYTIGEKNGNYRYFTVAKEYFASIVGGSVTLTLYTDGGRCDFTVTIVEPLTCDNAASDFDKNTADNVAFTVDGTPLTVISLKCGETIVEADKYAFDGGTLTIYNAYLQTLAYGEHTFTVTNGYGELTLTVTVKDSRVPALTNDHIEYTRGGNGVRVPVQMYGKTFTALRLGGTSVSEDNYAFENGVLTISGEYLNAQTGDTLTLTIVTSANSLTLTITFTEEVVLPEITAPEKGYEIDRQGDVEYAVDLKGNTFAGIKYGANALTEATDYELNTVSGELTVKAKYLAGIYRFGQSEYTLTLTTEEGNDVDFTVVYQNPENRILNGGFETGTLYGWNSYGIWKPSVEPGMIAWTDDRVVNGGYFDQNYSYNKDGNYNLGIYGGNISKDSGQERMGHLRSSNFTLGGSGWISFKLGGGKNSSFAYVSVRLASNNMEIARFGNPKFNSSTETGNGEAYMFQYYFDLSAHLDEQMYVTITDASSNAWCVLSADSFFTYYEAEPDTANGFVAVNILPTILNTDSADNSIKNGALDSNLDNWDNVNGVFKIDNGTTISSEGGNAAIGILRSSAFTVTDKQYLRFDWAGALKADKQIFVSVKEVGTNIEVLRFVRRDDLSGKINGDLDNHMLDLTSLSKTGKQYYLEFADNVDSIDDWSVSKIKNVRLVDKSEWDGVTSGDRAVSIEGLNTTFEYVLPYTTE